MYRSIYFEAGGSSASDGSSMTSSNADVAHVQTTVDDLQAVKAFRDPIITGAHAGGSGITDAVFDTYITTEPERDLKACAAALKTYRDAFTLQDREGADNDDTDQGTAIDFANTTWATLHGELSTFGTNCTKRIAEIDARIGVPTYSGSPVGDPGADGGANPPAVRVSAIPASNTTSGFVPYGRSLYNNCNHLLGQDVDLLGGIIKDVEGLSDLVDMVKTARNKYEIFSGRDKEYS